jgi:SOS-response transcriptional repressor LexA
MGDVGASSFVEVDEVDQHQELPTTPGVRSRRFPRAKHFALRVSGDCMVDRGINDGDIVHLVDWIDTGLSPISGMIVAVEESRFAGQMRRWTLKEVEVLPDRYVLNPRSPNKAHRPIVIMRGGEDDGTEIRIFGLVYHVGRDIGF